MKASEFIVIDDGQYLFPVRRSDLQPGDSVKKLRAMDADQYADWCSAVPAATTHTVGSRECIDFCLRLLDEGAERWTIG